MMKQKRKTVKTVKMVFWFNCLFLEAALPILVQSSLYVFGVRRKTGMVIHRELINKKCIKNIVTELSLPHTYNHYDQLLYNQWELTKEGTTILGITWYMVHNKTVELTLCKL